FGLSSNLQQRLQDFMHPDSASTPKVQQELLDFMGPDSANTQQVQQALQMKYQKDRSSLWAGDACNHGDLPEYQEQMKVASFRDLVIRGKELNGALITALINVYIKDNASVDAISNHLRDTCPLLYTSDDSVCSKRR
ncbi:hypothetical protein CRUP_007265, partial [Coryphaenoides rupestris]